MLGPWLMLTAAIASEIAATLSMKPAGDGSIPAIAVSVVGYVLSLVLLLLVLKRMDVSLAYAVWAGVGTAVVAAIGMTAMGEPANAVRIASIGLVILGVVGLNLSGAH